MLTRFLSIPTAALAAGAVLLVAAPWTARADDTAQSDTAQSDAAQTEVEATTSDAAAHPNQFRLGMYWIHSAASADDISGPFVPSGLNLSINDMYTPYFAYVRRLSPHFEVELAAGWPPLAKTIARGPAYLGSVPYNGQEISTARWFGPTLLFNYKVFDETHRFRPYFGIGVNYTKFYSRDSTPAGNAVAGGPTSIDLPASWGPAADFGLSYRVLDRLTVYTSYSYSYVASRLTATTAGLVRTTHVDFGPRALVISAGWSF